MKRKSGTGGFALYGETTVPINEDFNDPAGRIGLGLPDREGSTGPLRPATGPRGGRRQLPESEPGAQPRILGVRPEEFGARRVYLRPWTAACDGRKSVAAAGNDDPPM